MTDASLASPVRELPYDPFDAAIHAEPYEAYRRLRAAFPLYRNAERGFWALSCYDDVVGAARDNRRFSASRASYRVEDAVYGIRDPDWIAGDSPRHAILHKLMAPHLGPGARSQLERLVREPAERIIGRVVAEQSVDFVETVAKPLPISVICDLWDLPEDEREELERLSDRMWRREPGTMVLPSEVGDAYAGVRALVARTVARDGRRSGVLGALLRARRDGLLTESEVIDLSVLVPVTGFKTTSALLSAALLQLALHPDAQQALSADRSWAARVVEEILRFDPPVHWLPRVTTEDVALDHGVIPEGDRVLLLLGSANRDERRYRDPDRFDPARSETRHVAFGFGVHYCVGALLARILTTTVLELLFSRIDRVELAGPVERVYSSLGEREIPTLPLRLQAR